MRLNSNISISIILFCFLLMSVQAKAQSVKNYLEKQIVNQLKKSYPADSYKFAVSIKWVPQNLSKKNQDVIKSISYQGVGLPRDYVIYKIKYLDHGTLRIDRFQAHIRVEQKLPVTLHRLTFGQVIKGEDLVKHWVNVTKDSETFVSNPEKLKGKVVKHLVNKGVPIRLQDIRRIPVIHVGDDVSLLYSENGIRITLNCVARQPGAIGDKIRLFSQETGKDYIGLVKDKSQVIWEKTL